MDAQGSFSYGLGVLMLGLRWKLEIGVEKGSPKSSIGLSLCNINRIYSMFKCISHGLQARLRSPHR